MRFTKITALVFCLASLAAIAVCIFTDWNDGLYLPLALCLGAVGNGINVFSDNRGNGRREEK